MRRNKLTPGCRTLLLTALVLLSGCYDQGDAQAKRFPPAAAVEQHNVALARLKEGAPAAALSHAQAATAADPLFVEAYHTQGAVLAKLGRSEEAALALAEAVAAAPDAAETRLLYGIFLEQANRLEEARAAYGEAIRLYESDNATKQQPESQINQAMAVFLRDGKGKGQTAISAVLERYPGLNRAQTVQVKIRELDRAYFFRWAAQDVDAP